MTANIARTSSRALANAAIPFVSDLSGNGLESALRANPGLAAGVYMYRGKMVNDGAGATLGIPATPLHHLI
jgi:alanine dehydrogenase